MCPEVPTGGCLCHGEPWPTRTHPHVRIHSCALTHTAALSPEGPARAASVGPAPCAQKPGPGQPCDFTHLGVKGETEQKVVTSMED